MASPSVAHAIATIIGAGPEDRDLGVTYMVNKPREP
jgi:hypothetical protein